jgi:hypothetical protein
MEARYRNHYCRAKAVVHMLIVFVALVIQNAIRMRHIVIRGRLRSTIFFPNKRHDLKKNVNRLYSVFFYI